MKLYGIKNCDTVRKARKWLDAHNISYDYHDFREDGLSVAKVTDWIENLGEDALLNRRSTTWKNLDDKQKQNLSSKALIELLSNYPTLIKRPVLETGNTTLVGFSDKTYLALTK